MPRELPMKPRINLVAKMATLRIAVLVCCVVTADVLRSPASLGRIGNVACAVAVCQPCGPGAPIRGGGPQTGGTTTGGGFRRSYPR